jgi:hypothetical protein
MKLLYFTKSLLVPALLFTVLAANAADGTKTAAKDSSGTDKPAGKTPTQTAVADTSWKPVRRLWGYTFGDFYYDGHSDNGGRGGETNYGGVPSNRNSFQFRRIYLGYDYDINKKFSAVFLLASEPNASTAVANASTATVQNSDNLVDGKMALYIKYAYLKVNDLWPGTNLVLGEQPTDTWALTTEQVWGHRWIERTMADMHKLGNSFDVGAGLQGTFDPTTKNFGYNAIIGTNEQAVLASAATPNTGFYKIFYGDIWGKFLDKHLYLDLYADYVKTAPATYAIGAQSHNMWKALASYSVPVFTFGVEALSDNITNGVTAVSGTTKTPTNATAVGLSLFAYGSIVKDKLGYFARYDTYNPDNDFNTADSYTVNTNLSSYSPYQKEKFYTAGIDYTPIPAIHFSPNVWLMQFSDQRTPTTTGFIPNDHTVVYRLTFFYTFGK